MVRFVYDGPTRLDWRREKEKLKSVDGSWELEALGNRRTRATYRLEVELGRVLGLVIRAPLVDVLRGQLVAARAGRRQEARRRPVTESRSRALPRAAPAPTVLTGHPHGTAVARRIDGVRPHPCATGLVF